MSSISPKEEEIKFLKFEDIKIGDRISQDVYPVEVFQVYRKDESDAVLIFHPPRKPEEYMQLTPKAFNRMRFVQVIDIMKKRFGKRTEKKEERANNEEESIN